MLFSSSRVESITPGGEVTFDDCAHLLQSRRPIGQRGNGAASRARRRIVRRLQSFFDGSQESLGRGWRKCKDFMSIVELADARQFGRDHWLADGEVLVDFGGENCLCIGVLNVRDDAYVELAYVEDELLMR